MERYKSFGADAAICILLCLPLIRMTEGSQVGCPCPRGPICGTAVTADLNWDQKVDYKDLQRLAFYWLNGPGLGKQPADGPDPNFYDEKLRWLIFDAPQPIVPFQFYTSSSGWNPPWPGFYPMPELNTTDAVPFLIDVLLNGPDWSDERLLTAYGGIGPHIARCYAALCLGAIGDLRALEPLVETLEHGDYMEGKYTIAYHRKDEHNIRSYAAFALGLLGDCQAVDPLMESLKRERWPHCIYSLARLRAFRAVPTIIEVLSQSSYVGGDLHRTLQYMLKTDFTITRGEAGYVIDVFPELGQIDSRDVHKKLWLHWLEIGPEYTRKQFETYYAQRKAAIEENPLDDARHRYLQTQMLKGGVATLPYLMEKMEQGDNTLVPALATLTGDYWTTILCGPSECIQWWRQHQRDWLIFEHPLMAGCLRVPPDYPTIQAAIDDANTSDIVLVAPGIYTGDGNRDIDFKGKAITVKSEQGPETCIIDCQGTESGPHRGFDFHSGEGPNAILDGFTVTGGFVPGILQIGGAVRCQRPEGVRAYVSPTITNCIFRGNTAVAGGAIGLHGSQAVISSCIVWDNTAIASGGGIYCAYSSGPRIINCTIYGNRTEYGGGLCLGLGEGPSPALVKNCILWGNMSFSGSESFWQAPYGSPAGSVPLEIEYSCFFPVKLPPSDGLLPRTMITERNNIYVDPQFVDPNAGDFHLKSQAGRWDPVSSSWVKDDVTSPCIDAGDPNSPVGDEPFPNGGRINMGAYGGTVEASKSYFGRPLCRSVIVGDINGDCRVDFRDFALMAMSWPEGLAAEVDQRDEIPEPRSPSPVRLSPR